MDYTAHIVGSVASAFGVIYLSKMIGFESEPIMVVIGAAAGGIIPDIDHPKSKFGKAIRPFSDIIKAAVGHRTLTHSLLFISVVSGFGVSLHFFFGLGLAIGMISHVILDLLTPNTNGVAFLYPFKKQKIRLL